MGRRARKAAPLGIVLDFARARIAAPADLAAAPCRDPRAPAGPGLAAAVVAVDGGRARLRPRNGVGGARSTHRRGLPGHPDGLRRLGGGGLAGRDAGAAQVRRASRQAHPDGPDPAAADTHPAGPRTVAGRRGATDRLPDRSAGSHRLPLPALGQAAGAGVAQAAWPIAGAAYPFGHPGLRAAIASYLGEARGVRL